MKRLHDRRNGNRPALRVCRLGALLLAGFALIGFGSGCSDRNATPAAQGDQVLLLASDDPLTSPRTRWFREARFGMFIHWGLYSVLGGEWNGQRTPGLGEWILQDLNIPVQDYAAVASTFNPAGFDASGWVRTAKDAGMKYIVITAKHHDGFSLFRTSRSVYNVFDGTPFRRDPLAELVDAAHAEGIRIGFYYSILDWYDPQADGASFHLHYERMRAQIQELLTNYGSIDLLWFDGEWIGEWDQEKGRSLETFIRGIRPGIVVNNRIGKRTITDGDYETPEQVIPESADGIRLWESCMTLNDTWGYKYFDNNWKSPREIIVTLVDAASKGGNLLLNVGPDGAGVIPPAAVSVLQGVGAWLAENGEAIYGTRSTPIVVQPPWGRVTRKGDRLYLFLFEGNSDGVPLHLALNAPLTILRSTMLIGGASVPFQPDGDGFNFFPVAVHAGSYPSVIVVDIATGPLRDGNGNGLKGEYFADTVLNRSILTRTDETVNFKWGWAGSPVPPSGNHVFSARWTGVVMPRFSGVHTFHVISDNSVRLSVDQQEVILISGMDRPSVSRGAISLKAGEKYPIVLEYEHRSGEAIMGLYWSSHDQSPEIIPKAQLFTP